MPGRVLLVDNRDSFVWNLAQAVAGLLPEDGEVVVERSDRVDVATLGACRPDAVVLSPGPGRPAGAGCLLDAVRAFADAGTPMLGVCLGHQAIGEVFGAELVRDAPCHGTTSPVAHTGTGLFASCPNPFDQARYHSLVLDRASVRSPLHVTAWLAEAPGICMALQHQSLPIHGVQFHPESFLSGDAGLVLLRNFLATARVPCGALDR